jgi:hypothetical protein
MKIRAFWDISPCSLVGVDRRFRGMYCLHHHHQSDDDGGSTHLWNVGLLQWDYTAVYPRRLQSSYSLVWEPEISQHRLCLRTSYWGNILTWYRCSNKAPEKMRYLRSYKNWRLSDERRSINFLWIVASWVVKPCGRVRAYRSSGRRYGFHLQNPPKRWWSPARAQPGCLPSTSSPPWDLRYKFSLRYIVHTTSAAHLVSCTIQRVLYRGCVRFELFTEIRVWIVFFSVITLCSR